MKIPIVNEQDEVIGYKERDELDPTDIIRITGLWVTDPNGNILLARRAFTKKHHPGVWGPAVSGTVEEGETYESNIIKEAMEEIGLVGLKPILGPRKRLYLSYECFGQWFTAVVDHDYPFKKQDEEVEEIRWFSEEELTKFLKETPNEYLGNLREYINLFNHANKN